MARRERAGYSRRGLVRASGVPLGTLARIELGEMAGLPDPKDVQKIARALGVNLFDAFTRAGFFDNLTDAERETLETALALLELPERERRIVRVLIDELRR